MRGCCGAMTPLGLLLVLVAGAGAQVHSPVLGAATQVRRDYTVHGHNKQVNTVTL